MHRKTSLTFLANAKHLCDIYTMRDQRRKLCINVIQMVVFAGFSRRRIITITHLTLESLDYYQHLHNILIFAKPWYMYTAPQSQEPVSAYLKSKYILPFGFTRQNGMIVCNHQVACATQTFFSRGCSFGWTRWERSDLKYLTKIYNLKL